MTRLPERSTMLTHKNRNGFTFIEMLIALSILFIGLLSLAELQVIAIQCNKWSRDLTSAVILAETKLESLKGKGIIHLSNGTFQDTNNPVDETGGKGGIFTRSWTIADYQGSIHMKKITATIEWPEQKKKQVISFNTVLSDSVDNP